MIKTWAKISLPSGGDVIINDSISIFWFRIQMLSNILISLLFMKKLSVFFYHSAIINLWSVSLSILFVTLQFMQKRVQNSIKRFDFLYKTDKNTYNYKESRCLIKYTLQDTYRYVTEYSANINYKSLKSKTIANRWCLYNFRLF